MKEAAGFLDIITRGWASTEPRVIPEIDWSRMRSLDFQEALQSRRGMEKRLENRACKLCADFEGHVSPFFLFFLVQSFKLHLFLVV